MTEGEPTESAPTRDHKVQQAGPSSVLSEQDGWYAVDRVVDGDTIRVLTTEGSQAVRLIGIDTPEVVDPRRPVECFGREASEAAKRLLADQRVRLVSDNSQSDSDRYQRWLRYVYLEDGRMVNLLMLQEGYASEYTYDQPYLHRDTFRQAEQQARQAGRGLWSDQACLSEMD